MTIISAYLLIEFIVNRPTLIEWAHGVSWKVHRREIITNCNNANNENMEHGCY